MTIEAKEVANRAELLSALADGELGDDAATASLCAQWRADDAMQSRWHGYQLIGDVLRSEDLASTAAHDSAFLSALRLRLDAEPVVLAPASLGSAEVSAVAERDGPPANGSITRAGRPRRPWFAASAAAVGFVVVVAGALNFSRSPVPGDTLTQTRPDPAAPVVAVSEPSAGPLNVSAGDLNAAIEPQALVANGNLIRDARLDRYLAAHQQWSGGSVIGGHAAFLRHVAADAPKR